MNVMNKITMKQLCLILTISILPPPGFGQVVGDSIIVYVDNRVEIIVAVPDYIKLKSSDDVVTAMVDFQTLITEIVDQLSSGSPDLVKFSPGTSLTIEPGDPKYVFLMKDGELSNTGFRDHAIISGEGFQIFITASDLSKIADLSLSKCLEKVIAILPEKSNWSKSLYYECVDENVKELEDKSKVNPPLDFLELSAGAGANLLKGKWVADLSIGLGLGFNRKGALTYNPYVSANLVFDFDAASNTNINTFLNLGYRWNVNKKAEKPDMLGVELGYLIMKQGDLFGDNTFKLGFNWSPVKGVFISPQIYMTNNFKIVYPAIRIGIGF